MLLWNEQGNIISRPKLILQKVNNEHYQASSSTKLYPLFFSVELPEQHLNVILQPRMIEQEIAANRNSFWMGAVEARDIQTGQSNGKGNMYIFKQ